MANMDAFAISPSVYTLVVAPRRAGSRGNELSKITMSSQSQNSTSSTHSNKRRLQRSSDDEAVPSKISNKGSTNFVKFIVLTSQTDKPLTKISPFVIQKTIQSVELIKKLLK